MRFEYRLGDLLEIKYGKDHKKLNDGKIPVYGSGGIMRYADNCLYENESILIPRKGTLNNIFYVTGKFWTVDTIFWSKINTKLVFGKFLYYYLTTINFTNMNVGSAVPSMTSNVLNELKINIPPLPTQKKIAHILSTLDDKIELNRKMNETLEAMAQAMFKSWFVDFDPVHAKTQAKSGTELEATAKELGISKEILNLFPSKFQESEMGMIPEGWEVKTIKDFGRVITGKTPPTRNFENYGDKYPFITIPDMHRQTHIVNTDRYLSEIGHSVQKNKLLPINSLIVSCIATVGLVSINTVESHTNQQINSIICDKKYLYFLYSLLRTMTEQLKMYGSAGTATLNVNKSTFENIKSILPPEVILKKYLELMEGYFKKIQKNQENILTLQKTRDTLLPKLLSGELDVSKLHIGLDDAAQV